MILKIILLIVILLILFIFIRALRFKPYKEEDREKAVVEFDKKRAVKNLQELIKCKTVSRYDKTLENEKEFRKLLDKLPKLYPNVFKVCEYTEFSTRAILFKWSGKDKSLNPGVLMAHFDVVPVEEENWLKPPFAAIIEDDVLWGRGSLDTKVTFNGVLNAADELIKKQYEPNRDIYFAFSGQEEVNGPEADDIVTWFKERNIEPEYVIDEGGAVVENVFPGVSFPCGLIGICEKGMMNVTYEVKSNGGHASAPKPHTPIGELSLACSSIESHPFKMHLTKPAKEMFDTLGRYSSFGYKIIFSNLWLFKGILDKLAKKSGGEMNALLRTTVAFTQMEGSLAPNVIPPKATMVSNIRLNPADSVDSALKYLKKVINNNDVKLNATIKVEPSRISRTDTLGWKIVKNAVADTWEGSLVSPYLMVQCSDSRHYGRISDRVYRFSAMDLTSEERASIHGNNERIRLDTLYRAIEFYIRVMLNS